ncbi:MAG: SH3 domain-containing protein [Chloroflexi bacterium]|nr:SH3 domain-containing protein [Chloroflexota bacterium]
MKRNNTLIHFSFALILVFLQACNLPGGAPDGTPTVDPLEAAALTVTAAAIQVDATATLTATPEFTATPAFTPTLAFTSTPSFAYVNLSENTNCRTGPGQAYPLVDTFLIGQTIEVLGKNSTNEYWYVRSPNNQNVFCWMWGFYAKGGNLGNVPIFTPPPSPTPAPSFDVSYAGVDSCVGWWIDFNLKNTSTVAFKSVGITVKDTVTGVSLGELKDGFTDLGGCLSSSIIATLDPGQTYTVSSAAFVDNPVGHKIEATINLCTGLLGSGTCVTKNIEFTP